MLGVTGATYYPHTFLKNFCRMRNWKIVDYKDKRIIVGSRKDPHQHNHSGSVTLKLAEGWFDTFFCEWPYWNKWYSPNFSLKGKTVLDVGAGCGESAAFFFLSGVHQVIGIESDPVALECLRENAKNNHWKLEIVPRKFELSDLNRCFDFLKMDIEGGEMLLLGIDRLPPCSIEVHGMELLRRFMERFPYLRIFRTLGRTPNWILKG